MRNERTWHASRFNGPMRQFMHAARKQCKLAHLKMFVLAWASVIVSDYSLGLALPNTLCFG